MSNGWAEHCNRSRSCRISEIKISHIMTPSPMYHYHNLLKNRLHSQDPSSSIYNGWQHGHQESCLLQINGFSGSIPIETPDHWESETASWWNCRLQSPTLPLDCAPMSRARTGFPSHFTTLIFHRAAQPATAIRGNTYIWTFLTLSPFTHTSVGQITA